MRQMILTAVATATVLASQSFASTATANLGFSRSALAFGGSYEHGDSDANLGGYFLHQTEKKKSGTVVVAQSTTFGGMYNIHVYKKSNVDVYVAPGFGINMTDDNTGDSTTVFGPSMKIGAQLALTSKVRLGVERLLITNWFSDDVAGSAEFTTAALSFDF